MSLDPQVWWGYGHWFPESLGALRDIVVANILGATAVADAFVAQTIPNVFRRLVGEGAVSVVLVPTYAERLAQEGQGGRKTLCSSAPWDLVPHRRRRGASRHCMRSIPRVLVRLWLSGQSADL